MRKVECAHVLVSVATPGDLWPHYALCTNMLHNGKRARSFLQIESSERDRDRERGRWWRGGRADKSTQL